MRRNAFLAFGDGAIGAGARPGEVVMRPGLIRTPHLTSWRCLRWVSRASAASLMVLGAAAVTAGYGERIYNEYVDSGAIYPDENWQTYVQEIGERLLSYTDSKKRFTFVVVDKPSVNAMALEDGYIFIFRGLLHYLNTEDELAAVIGHEIGHVVANHHQEGRLRSRLGQIASLAGYGLTGRSELLSVTGYSFHAYQASFGREGELEADRIGAELLAKAGYDPLAVIDAVHVLKDQDTFSKQVKRANVPYHSLFSTHPRNDKRLHDAVNVARTLSTGVRKPPVRDFWQMIDGVSYLNEGSTGAVRDTTYYNTSIRVVMEFPDGWVLRFNEREVSGQSTNGRDDSWARITKVANGERYKPEAFIKKGLNREDVVDGNTIEVDGKEFYVAELDASVSEVKRSVLGLVYRNREVFVVRMDCGVLCVEEQFDKDLRVILSGIRPMSAEDRALIQVNQIRVITAEPGDTYAELATRSSIRGYPEEMLRLLNADYPHGEPRAGDFIKIVQ